MTDERPREPRPWRQGLARAVPAAPIPGWGLPPRSWIPLFDGGLCPPAPRRARLAPDGTVRAAQAVQRSADSSGPTTRRTGRVQAESWPPSLPTATGQERADRHCHAARQRVEAGLPPGYVIPPGTRRNMRPWSGSLSVNSASRMCGAGAGPADYDCSGLTMAAGDSRRRPGARGQHPAERGGGVGVAALVPGDLVLVPGSDSPGPGSPATWALPRRQPRHLAIDPQYGVAVQSWTTFVSGGLIALRDRLRASNCNTEKGTAVMNLVRRST